MDAPVPTYHRRMAEEKRALIVQAATRLFLASGYDRTSLARVADEAGVSRATLFKQFPTKAALFEAMITATWDEGGGGADVPTGDLTAVLLALGHRYAALLGRREMQDLFRIVIAELPRFPELARAQFSLGKLPYFETVRRHLAAAHEAGTARIDDPELATTQFLGMISNALFWPALLLPDWSVDADRVSRVVEEGVRTTTARYAVRAADPGP
ncbi:TetR family transcriptional regulator [Pseudonocardia sp. AL041005-10]|nr:TetR/AcrR family transcriptional regulator [Pseudonocardia sp. AL041005-10]ALE80060.1 TetR family transcriptional regulator [Pseudonocardia sp. AL041005-10]